MYIRMCVLLHAFKYGTASSNPFSVLYFTIYSEYSLIRPS